MGDEYIPSSWDMASNHVERYLATNGVDGYEFHGVICVILTTRGRRTGAIRRSPLIRLRDGDRYLLVASMGGADKHPSWYLNLVANPDVTIQDRDQIHQLVARTADATEKKELWPLAVGHWPEYDTYQRRTERDIPLVICEPGT